MYDKEFEAAEVIRLKKELIGGFIGLVLGFIIGIGLCILMTQGKG